MAARKTHYNMAIIFWAITMAIIKFRDNLQFTFEKDTTWILLGLILAIYGGEFPDIDQMYKKVFNHRDFFTHSAILPGIMFYVAFTTKDSHPFNVGLFPVLAMFNIGVASHMLSDYFPTWDNETKDGKLQLSDVSYAAKFVVDGLSGEELTQKLVGTYLIHFPKFFKRIFGRSTLNKNLTRFWLLANAAALIAMAFVMLSEFAGF